MTSVALLAVFVAACGHSSAPGDAAGCAPPCAEVAGAMDTSSTTSSMTSSMTSSTTGAPEGMGGSTSTSAGGAGSGPEAAVSAGGGPSPSTDSATTTGGEPAATCPSSEVFDDAQVHTFRLEITEEDLDWLENNGDLEEYVPGDLSYDDEPMGQVGIRYKGSPSSLGRCWTNGMRSYFGECAKVSMKLKFDKYVSDTRLCGLKRVNLHSMRADGAKLKERLAYKLFRDMGVHTSRVTHARLYINGEFRGLFALVEQIDGRFTADRWPEAADGNLFKELWPGLDYFAEEDGEIPWEERVIDALRTNEDIADVTEMTALDAVIQASTPESFVADLSPLVDLDNFLRYMAVDRAISNVDGVTRFYSPDPVSPQYTASNHNFYIYQLEAGGKFVFLPWDLDLTFSYPDEFLYDYGLPNWNQFPDDCTANLPIWGYAKPPACDRFLGNFVRNYWDEFVLVGEEFLAGPFQAEPILADLERWSTQIEPIIQEDENIDGADWQEQVQILRDNIPPLIQAYRDHLGEGVDG